MIKQGKKYRKKLLKMLESGKYDFILEHSGYQIDGVRQFSKVIDIIAKQYIEFSEINHLKDSLMIVPK